MKQEFPEQHPPQLLELHVAPSGRMMPPLSTVCVSSPQANIPNAAIRASMVYGERMAAPFFSFILDPEPDYAILTQLGTGELYPLKDRMVFRGQA